MKRRFKKHCDTDSEVLWLSEEINHDDWPFRFALKLTYLEEYSDFKNKYLVEIYAVSPEAAGVTNCERAAESCGQTLEAFKALDSAAQCEVLLSYGVSAMLWSKMGNNKNALLKAARKEMIGVDMLFGFYMDRPLNAIGSTGWDFIKGDIMAGLNKKKEGVPT